MPGKSCQHTNADPLASQRSNEAAPAGMASSALYSSLLVNGVHRLTERIGGERSSLLRGEEWPAILRAHDLLEVQANPFAEPVVHEVDASVLALVYAAPSLISCPIPIGA